MRTTMIMNHNINIIRKQGTKVLSNEVLSSSTQGNVPQKDDYTNILKTLNIPMIQDGEVLMCHSKEGNFRKIEKLPKIKKDTLYFLKYRNGCYYLKKVQGNSISIEGTDLHQNKNGGDSHKK